MSKKKVTWTKNALHDFDSAIKFIRKDSEQNAVKVRESLLTRIAQLA